MRSIANDPKARTNAIKRAQKDADFYLKCCEQGYGRPGTHIDVRHGGLPGEPIEFKAVFDDGTPIFAALEAVSEEAGQ